MTRLIFEGAVHEGRTEKQRSDRCIILILLAWSNLTRPVQPFCAPACMPARPPAYARIRTHAIRWTGRVRLDHVNRGNGLARSNLKNLVRPSWTADKREVDDAVAASVVVVSGQRLRLHGVEVGGCGRCAVLRLGTGCGRGVELSGVRQGSVCALGWRAITGALSDRGARATAIRAAGVLHHGGRRAVALYGGCGR
jgi:hypothetical protein